MLFMAFLTHLVETREMDEQKSEKLSFFLQEVSTQMKGLDDGGKCQQKACMMRTCQVILT